MDDTSVKTAEILAALAAAGIAERDLQTRALRLNPNWANRSSTPGAGPKIDGFVASNTVMVRVNQRLLTTPYTGSTQADLQTWLTGLNAAPEAALFPATLSFTPQGADRFTVESRGSAGGAVTDRSSAARAVLSASVCARRRSIA